MREQNTPTYVVISNAKMYSFGSPGLSPCTLVDMSYKRTGTIVCACVCTILTTRQAKFVRWVHWQPTTLVDSLNVVSVQPSVFQSPLPSIIQCDTL